MSEDSDHNEDCERPRKRRRVLIDDETIYSDLIASSGSDGSPEDSQTDGRKPSPEVEKPKSKYKIHVPKNGAFPTDSFFTQPRSRSTSPYRIGSFHWRKKAHELTQATKNAPVSVIADDVSKQQNQGNTSIASHSGPITKDAGKNNVSDDFDPDESYENILANVSQDALPSSLARIEDQEATHLPAETATSWKPSPKLVAPLANLKQSTLFGTQAEQPSSQRAKLKRNWPMANQNEPPTHHELDREAMNTWVYPINLGTIRDYQFSIVATGLYHNMLVALPTGLGKTFIAATIMMNWFRWTKSAQIVFVAPTRPLVSQQVKACFEIAGIPRSATTMLTGTTPPGLRTEEWQTKRVFFMTPQTLINDLKSGICDPKRLVLIVVDEAHRATGNYAYVEVVTFVKRFNSSFRILALTATPGSSIESVQEVINGLGISRIEIRTEESLDIRQYVHLRKTETVLFDNSEEMSMVMELFSKALQPAVDKICSLNAYWNKDPMNLTPYGCTQARQKWFVSDAGRKAHPGVKNMVMSIFSLLAKLSHAIELLKFHGIGPFFQKVLAFRNDIHAGGKKGDKYSNEINSSPPFQQVMSRVQIWINSADFIGHPKLEYLQRVVLNHFLDAGEGRGAADPSSTRVMVFAHFRHSAEEIARVLKRNEPMIRPHVFVGQSAVKDSDGMDQKMQLEIIKKFKSGVYNTLVATSIGEEGLDIGEVDLIICYDASASPIRMLQRMGRTGRKRTGNIVVTLMRGKEENNFIKAKDNYEKMQTEIASGARFAFHEGESRRIVPREIQPVVEKKIIDIPFENTQADLPEPVKRGRPPKRPAKKFHMPDGVRTGFVKASRIEAPIEDSDIAQSADEHSNQLLPRAPSPVSIPDIREVLLTSQEDDLLERQYLNVTDGSTQVVEVPRLNKYPQLQRSPRPTKYIGHGSFGDRIVRSLNAMHQTSEGNIVDYATALHADDRHIAEVQASKRTKFHARSKVAHPANGRRSPLSERAINIDMAAQSTFETSGSGGAQDNENVDVFTELSQKSTQSSLADMDTFLGQPNGKVCNRSAPSDDDLPDFDITVLAKGTSVKRARISRKNIVDEDSDDE